jgi:hypothetical protein
MITWMLMCAKSIQRSDTFNISTYNVQKRILSEWWFYNNQKEEEHFFEDVNSMY